MDKQTVFEHALTRLGQQQYRANAETRAACEQTYQRVLRLALARHAWNFSRVIATLTRGADGTFTLPADCIRLQTVLHGGHKVRHFDIFGRTLTCDAPSASVTITYQSDLSNIGGGLPDTAPFFEEGVISLLAAKISPIITGNPAPQTDLEQEAEHYFRRAATLDAYQNRSNDQHPLSEIRELNIFN